MFYDLTLAEGTDHVPNYIPQGVILYMVEEMDDPGRVFV